MLASGAVCAYQNTVDILADDSLEEISVDIPLDDDLSDGEIGALAEHGVLEFLLTALPPEALLFMAAQVFMGMIEILLMTITELPSSFQLNVLNSLVTVYMIAMFAELYSTWRGVGIGKGMGVGNKKEAIKYWKMAQKVDIPYKLKKTALAILGKEE
jgi:hypothetical protein